jgi:hypothetical protein
MPTFGLILRLLWGWLRLLTKSILIRFQRYQDESGYENRFRSGTSDFGLFRYLKSIYRVANLTSYVLLGDLRPC